MGVLIVMDYMRDVASGGKRFFQLSGNSLANGMRGWFSDITLREGTIDAGQPAKRSMPGCPVEHRFLREPYLRAVQ